MKFGVILSGCGVFDGSEIHEAVITMLCLDQHSIEYQCMAPNVPQMHVINHLAGQAVPSEERNALIESARIARGDVHDLAEVKVADYDAFILPGGFGAAKNLCDFAKAGADMTVNDHVERVLLEAKRAGLPMGFICIAPVIAAKLFGQTAKARITIGHDKSTAEKITAMKARHDERDVNDICVDEGNRIVTTPAYMEAKSIKEAYAGISKLVEKVIELARQPVEA